MSKRSRISRMLHSRLTIGGLILICALPLAGLAVARPSKHSAKLRYAASITSSPDRGKCYNAVGIYTGLYVDLHRHPSAAEYKKLIRANTPRSPVLIIGRNRYRLMSDPNTSAYGSAQISWGYKRVVVGAATAKRAIHQRAYIAYKIGNKSHETRKVKVVDGRCKSYFE